MTNQENDSYSIFFHDDIQNILMRLILAISLVVICLILGIYWVLWTTGALNFVGVARFAIAPLAAMGFAILLGARYVQDIYELPTYIAGIQYMLAALFGFRYPVLKITNGHSILEPDGFNLLDKIGGPGWLIVEPGNIVLLERLDSPSDVRGAGVHFVNRFHRIKNIISLKDQHAAPRDVTAITKDGIFVTVRDFQFGFRLETGHRNISDPTHRTLSNPYPYSVKAAKNVTYNRSITKDGTPVPWDKAVQFSIDSAITDYINQHFLDQILFPLSTQEDPRYIMSRDITEKKRAGLRMYGAELLWHDIGPFDVAPTIQEQMIKAWSTKWIGNASVLRAEGDAVEVTSQERGRAEGEVDMLNSVMRALDDDTIPEDLDENMWNIVLSYTAQIIEGITGIYDTEGSPEDKK